MRHSSDHSDEPLHATDAAPGDPLLGRALALVRFLREHCPWDARQDPRSLRPYLLEEAHEVAEAIAARDDRALAGELGDLLLNVAFQVVLAEERGAFGAREVVEGLEAKMRDRHPHIYGDAEAPVDWEELKARLRAGGREPPAAANDADGGPDAEGAAGGSHDPLAGVPAGLEPLARALRLQERVAAAGFDWPDARGPLAKVREEADEVAALLDGRGAEAGDPDAAGGRGEPGGPEAGERLDAELGDLLFAVVNLARLVDVHPSTALLGALEKFQRRVREVWRRAAEAGVDPAEASLETLDGIWDEVKADEADEP